MCYLFKINSMMFTEGLVLSEKMNKLKDIMRIIREGSKDKPIKDLSLCIRLAFLLIVIGATIIVYKDWNFLVSILIFSTSYILKLINYCFDLVFKIYSGIIFPVVILVFILLFRTNISELINRIEFIKAFGTEVKIFKKELEEFFILNDISEEKSKLYDANLQESDDCNSINLTDDEVKQDQNKVVKSPHNVPPVWSKLEPTLEIPDFLKIIL